MTSEKKRSQDIQQSTVGSALEAMEESLKPTNADDRTRLGLNPLLYHENLRIKVICQLWASDINDTKKGSLRTDEFQMAEALGTWLSECDPFRIEYAEYDSPFNLKCTGLIADVNDVGEALGFVAQRRTWDVEEDAYDPKFVPNDGIEHQEPPEAFSNSRQAVNVGDFYMNRELFKEFVTANNQDMPNFWKEPSTVTPTPRNVLTEDPDEPVEAEKGSPAKALKESVKDNAGKFLKNLDAGRQKGAEANKAKAKEVKRIMREFAEGYFIEYPYKSYSEVAEEAKCRFAGKLFNDKELKGKKIPSYSIKYIEKKIINGCKDIAKKSLRESNT